MTSDVDTFITNMVKVSLTKEDEQFIFGNRLGLKTSTTLTIEKDIIK